MPPTSLRRHLLLWLLLPMVPLAAMDAWFSYRGATETATEIFDRMLLGSARIIGEQIRIEDGVPQSYIPPAALELFESVYRDRVYYRIAGADGHLLLGYPELPAPPANLKPEEVVHFDADFRSEPLRLVAFAQPVFGASALNPVVVEVGQTMNGPRRLAFAIWSRSVTTHLLVAALLVGLLLLGLRRGLAPLLTLNAQVRVRNPGSLERLPDADVPSELQPLVRSINDYVQRLDARMSAHSRFIANAAHQLRTPLTVLNTQVTFGLQEPGLVEKDAALRAIRQGVRQSTRVVNQLLTFSVAETRHIRTPRSATDLVQIVREVLETLAVFAQSRGIDLGCDMPESLRVAGNTAMTRELVSNLVDNALRYTQAGGTVTVTLHSEAGQATLLVEDDGPGIPTEERERVFERFYRLHNDKSDGCGLGLAIVREVATAMNGTVTLSQPAQGTGLIVKVQLEIGTDGPIAAAVAAATPVTGVVAMAGSMDAMRPADGS
jgi:two-component system sensor histidine kinase TctE